ncbi:MFS transporter [Rhodoferax sp.]|uniref:MFS transporter n=1 Tax=Rhodoferax sp. TaxID=50421 RepID=UPI002716C142|nr:MFS transporter [Rhodoferax sp.]MDO9196498.1 MFS transporter [Rhodoferax sp.]
MSIEPPRLAPYHLRLFFLSCLLSFTGGHMVNYSVIIYAQEVLGSDVLSGVGFALCFGPPLVLGWYAGVLCDRMAPGRIIHAAQWLLLAAALTLALGNWLADGSALRTAFVLGAALLAGVGWSFVAPARMTALAQIVTPQRLPRAALVLNLLVMIGFGLGPLGISVLRTAGGWPLVFAMAAALFVVSSLLLLPVATMASHKPHRPVRQEVAEGLRAVRASPLLSQLLLAAMFGYMMMGPMQVMLPRFARQVLALSELHRGAFLGALAPALMAGGVLAMLVARRVANGRAILTATLAAGVCFGAIGFTRSPLAATILLAAAGMAGGMAISLIVTGIQGQVQVSVRGRVLAMYTIISQVVPALSGLVAGALVYGLGAAHAIVAAGAAIAVLALANMRWMGALRGYQGVAAAQSPHEPVS